MPNEISIAEDARLTVVSDQMDINCQMRIELDKYIYLENAFPNGYAPPTPFSFTLWGFTNPPTAAPTDSFHVVIFYEEDD